MKQPLFLLLAVLAGAAIALGGVAVAERNDDTPTMSPEVRVVAEGRFEQAAQEMQETYRRLLEKELPGVTIPSFEGPEPCVGIADAGLRRICIEGLR